MSQIKVKYIVNREGNAHMSNIKTNNIINREGNVAHVKHKDK